MSERLWRLALLSVCCCLTLYFCCDLIDLSEREQLRIERVKMLQQKSRHLEKAREEKKAWLSSGDKIKRADIATYLSELRLCESVLDTLMQNAYHPFLKDPSGVTALLDQLDHNQILLKETKGTYALVRPVYMEEKDLEKMIQIIENKGAFSPVEVKELDFKKESLLGGELWRVEHLVFGPVDADGALL